MSLPTLRNDLAKVYEPKAPSPSQRLATLQAATPLHKAAHTGHLNQVPIEVLTDKNLNIQRVSGRLTGFPPVC